MGIDARSRIGEIERTAGPQGAVVIQIRDIGVSLKIPGNVFTPHQLELALGRLAELGYPLVEIDPSLYALIFDGELRPRQLADFLAVTRGSGLRFSVHGFGRLNLAYDPRHELCKKIMRAQIALCAAMGATRLVYHSGLQALDEVKSGVRAALLTTRELEEGALREVAAFKELAPMAADAGVVICMENLDPHLWEHTLIRSFGLPPSEIDRHLARLRIGPIVRQLEAIDHSSVGMTLDVAHLHLASHDLGFSYLDAVSEAAPWARHLHVTDNFGRLDTGNSIERDRWAFGEADMHMPPGWGSIPYAEVFERLPDYRDDLILEILVDFHDHLGEARANMQSILGVTPQ
jgi:sugar phosphate isomerase/epimerase